MSAKTKLIIGFFGAIVLVALWQLIRVNTTLRDAVESADERNADYELRIKAYDQILKQNNIDVDSAELVALYLREELENIIIIRNEQINSPVPNYIDVMSYSDEQKRSEISRLVKDIDIKYRQFRKVLEGDSANQRHNEVPLQP